MNNIETGDVRKKTWGSSLAVLLWGYISGGGTTEINDSRINSGSNVHAIILEDDRRITLINIRVR